MRYAPTKTSPLISTEAISAEITRLSNLSLAGLRSSWHAEFRKPAPRGLWRDLLLRSLAFRLQEKAFGGHDKATLRLLEAHARERPGDPRCRRLKAGTVLIREFGGNRHTVIIVPAGYLWQDKTYSSLTAIARAITGTNWNGPRFFGLREGKGRKGREGLQELGA